MAVQRIDEAIQIFMQKAMRGFHTSVPGVIVGIDYSKPTVDIQPSVETDFGDDYKPDTYPVIYDVPLFIPSAGAGKAKITVPVKVGDRASLHFSERNPNSKTDLTTHGLYGCYAVSGLEGEIDPENIIIQNEIAKATIKPDGTMILSSGNANIIAQPDGNVNINGLIVTPTGNVITSGGVDLDLFYQTYLNHLHSGVQRGSSNTDKPV